MPVRRRNGEGQGKEDVELRQSGGDSGGNSEREGKESQSSQQAKGSGGDGREDAQEEEKQSNGPWCSWLNVVGFVFGVLFLPIMLNNAGLQHEALAMLPADEHFFTVGYGTQLYLECMGRGRETVVIEADVGAGAEEYRPLAEALSPWARVCIYDRAGLGHSGQRTAFNPPTDPYTYMGSQIKPRSDKVGTSERAAEDLHWLLQKANVSLPVTLASFGLSAMTSRFYAQLNEGAVANLILIDPVHESLLTDSSTATEQPPLFYQYWYGTAVPAQDMRQLSAFMGWTRLAIMAGVLRPPQGMGNATYAKHLACHGDHQRSVGIEMLHANETASQLTILNQFRPLAHNVSRHVLVHAPADTDHTPAGGGRGHVRAAPGNNPPYTAHPAAEKAWRDGVHLVARDLNVEVETIQKLTPHALAAAIRPLLSATHSEGARR